MSYPTGICQVYQTCLLPLKNKTKTKYLVEGEQPHVNTVLILLLDP
jgi:hypothetical protein